MFKRDIDISIQERNAEQYKVYMDIFAKSAKFNKLNYELKLKFWIDNNLDREYSLYTHYIYNIDSSILNEMAESNYSQFTKIREESKVNEISIIPTNNRDMKLYIEFIRPYLISQFGNTGVEGTKNYYRLYDSEELKSNFLNSINENSFATEILDEQISDYESMFKEKNDDMFFKLGYYSVKYNQEIDFKYYENLHIILEGVCVAKYLRFLKDYKVELKNNSRGSLANINFINARLIHDRESFEQIQIDANKIKDLKERIIFWSQKKVEYHKGIDFNILAVSGTTEIATGLKQEFFLDRLITQEMEHLEKCLSLENVLEDDYIEQEFKDLQEKICLLAAIGIIDYIRISQKGCSNDLIGKLLQPIVGMNFNTISQYLGRIDREELMSKYNNAIDVRLTKLNLKRIKQ